jgi:hypothetical protein
MTQKGGFSRRKSISDRGNSVSLVILLPQLSEYCDYKHVLLFLV